MHKFLKIILRRAFVDPSTMEVYYFRIHIALGIMDLAVLSGGRYGDALSTNHPSVNTN